MSRIPPCYIYVFVHGLRPDFYQTLQRKPVETRCKCVSEWERVLPKDGGADAFLFRFHIFQWTTLMCVNVSLIRASIIIIIERKRNEKNHQRKEKKEQHLITGLSGQSILLYLVHYIIRNDYEVTIHRRRWNESILHIVYLYRSFVRTHFSCRWNIFRIFTTFYQSMNCSHLRGLKDITVDALLSSPNPNLRIFFYGQMSLDEKCEKMRFLIEKVQIVILYSTFAACNVCVCCMCNVHFLSTSLKKIYAHKIYFKLHEFANKFNMVRHSALLCRFAFFVAIFISLCLIVNEMHNFYSVSVQYSVHMNKANAVCELIICIAKENMFAISNALTIYSRLEACAKKQHYGHNKMSNMNEKLNWRWVAENATMMTTKECVCISVPPYTQLIIIMILICAVRIWENRQTMHCWNMKQKQKSYSWKYAICMHATTNQIESIKAKNWAIHSMSSTLHIHAPQRDPAKASIFWTLKFERKVLEMDWISEQNRQLSRSNLS